MDNNLNIQSATPLPGQGSLVVKLPDGTDYVMYTPSDKQFEGHISEIPKLCLWGNRGGGKSMFLRMDAHMRALSVPNSRLILVRETYPQLLASHLVYIHKEMMLLGGKYNEGKKCAFYPNGSQLFFRHVGNERDSLDQLSAEFIAAYFDELSTIPWDYFTKICASVRVPPGLGIKGVVRAATNPLGPSAEYVRQYFVDKDVDPKEDPDYFPDDWGAIKIQLSDNTKGVDQEQYIRQLKAMPPNVRKAWLDGEFALEHALFEFFPTKMIADDEGKERMRPYHVITEAPLFKGKPVFSLY